jgi:GTP pyrophosphokinase
MTDEKLWESVGNNKDVKQDSHEAKAGIIVQGLSGVAVHLSKCCSPVPGDEIVGFVTRGRGVSVHRTDCINIINASEDDRHRMIAAEWNFPEGEKTSEYYAEIRIYANNRSGVLLDISKIFSENKIDIQSLNSRTSKQGTATITVGFQVKGKEQLQYVITKISNVESVLDVTRTAG